MLDVEGEHLDSSSNDHRPQDFVMVNYPIFLARSVKDYLRLEQVLVKANDNPLTVATQALTGGSWNPLDWHWREVATIAEVAAQLPTHPASNTYYSMAPIRYGQYVAKYRVRSKRSLPDSWTDIALQLATAPNAMQQLLESTLRSHALTFELQVQLRTSESMPVEDPTIEWSEQKSPFRTVADIEVPIQELDRLQAKADCQQWAFSVWNALQSHRPLGGINRLRRAVYPISAAWRRKP